MKNTPCKFDVFISYSRRDFDEVNKFVETLKQRIPELTYWFDLTGIESGEEEFDEKIISAIDESSYVLFFISEHSMDSKWTKKEVVYANNIDKKVVPVILRETTLRGWFIFNFGRIDCINITDPKQNDKLLRDLSAWTGKELKAIGITTIELHKLVARYTTLQEQITELCAKRNALLKKMESSGVNVSELLGKLIDAASAAEMPEFKTNDTILNLTAMGRSLAEKANAVLKSTITPENKTNTINGHAFVDLGLSVKWATCNIGADSPEECGDYFAWGEIRKKKTYTPDTSHTYNADMECISGNSNYDAARANWGSTWRLPTDEEIKELLSKCVAKWTTQNGIKGVLIRSTINGHSIFLPAAGWHEGKDLYRNKEYCRYWSGSSNKGKQITAIILHCNSNCNIWCSIDRSFGFCIRPVSD